MQFFPRLLLLAGLLLLNGCAGYKLGPSNGQMAGAKSVSVKPFLNKTIEPRVGDAITQATRKAIQRDGTYRLDTGTDGDVIVSGDVVRFERLGATYMPGDVMTILDYQLLVTVHVVARERGSSKVLFDRNVSANNLVRVQSNVPNAEQQAVPLIAADIGRSITSLLADGTW